MLHTKVNKLIDKPIQKREKLPNKIFLKKSC